MAIVNKIDIKAKSIENFPDFAPKFSQRINWHTCMFDELRAIFDRYDVKSLKGNTKAGQNKGFLPFHYKVTNTSRKKHLELFISLYSKEPAQQI